MRGASVEPDDETYQWYREWAFRRVFGGSHADFMDQPLGATDWLTEIESRLSEQA